MAGQKALLDLWSETAKMKKRQMTSKAMNRDLRKHWNKMRRRKERREKWEAFQINHPGWFWFVEHAKIQFLPTLIALAALIVAIIALLNT